VTPAVYLYDDPADLPRFAPFAASRPIGELRCGAWLLRERAERALGIRVAGHIAAPHLAGFVDPGAPPAVAPPAGGPRVVLRSTFAFAADAPAPDLGEPGLLRSESGDVIGVVLGDGAPFTGLPGGAGSTARACAGERLTGAWELVANLPARLLADLAVAREATDGARVPAGTTVLGDPADLLIEDTAAVEPLVVLDTRNGPIWIRAGAEVRSGSRLAGPLVIGEHTRVVGGQLRESTVGPWCVIHGEVSNSVFLGYANKSHDGFLGHSVVGRWANLGAGTITSNLKNTYGPVRLNLGAERIETGLTFLGSLIGDHVKTAIGTMLPTGCVLGTGANVFGTARPSNAVAPFAWGTDEIGRVMACRMFLQTAERVLPRRGVPFGAAERAYLTRIWEHATGQPCG